MCGLAGLFVHSPSPGFDPRGSARDMAATLRHRGPDDHGDWASDSGAVAFGFRRLSIQDRSQAGHQPMTSPSGRYTVVLNGEIYNFLRLRKELGDGVYRGGSDTEVLLHAFDAWGIDGTLPRLVGMFALAVWDEGEGELRLIRDRLGIKPLYLARTRWGLAFASELSAILRAPGLDRALDPGAIRAYLQYLYFPAPSTPFRDVRKLDPGHMVRIRSGQWTAEGFPPSLPWWSLEEVRAAGRESLASEGPPSSDEEAADRLEALLEDAVGLRMLADVPVGALLSGGIDSSLVVALMRRRSSGPVRTFTIGFDDPDHDESGPSRAVARHLRTEHTELHVTAEDALALVPELPRIFDEPLADPSQVPTRLVSALAREHVTVALSGDGGDELFGGYNRYHAGLGAIRRSGTVPRWVRSPAGHFLEAVPTGAWRLAEGLSGRNGGGARLLHSKARKLGRLLRAPSPAEMYRSLLTTRLDVRRLVRSEGEAFDPLGSLLRSGPQDIDLSTMLLADQRYYLPDDLLQKVDRASMSVGLEVRVPLLDHRVVEFAWALPDGLKIRDGQGKWILRKLLERHVPRRLVDRPKTGFSVPLAGWLRGALLPWAEDTLLAPNPFRDHLFRAEVIRNSWRRFQDGDSEEALGIWALLMFESWRARWDIEDLSQANACAS
jgi:asparagine synthase (glutamine-hydrolysing)